MNHLAYVFSGQFRVDIKQILANQAVLFSLLQKGQSEMTASLNDINNALADQANELTTLAGATQSAATLAEQTDKDVKALIANPPGSTQDFTDQLNAIQANTAQVAAINQALATAVASVQDADTSAVAAETPPTPPAGS